MTVELSPNSVYLRLYYWYHFRAIVAGDHKFVFLVKGHLILVAISYAKESQAQVNVFQNFTAVVR